MAQWYIFTTVSGADPLNPNNYSSPQALQPLCPGTTKICAVLADDNGFNKPNITQELEEDIIRALQFGMDQSHVVLRA